MTKLLVDMCVDRRVSSGLRDLGHDAVHVGEIGMGSATDHEVMEFAAKEARIVVTHDSDFAQFLARSGAEAPSIVRVRMPTAALTEVTAAVASALAAATEELETGAIVSVSERGARIRPLPLRTAESE